MAATAAALHIVRRCHHCGVAVCRPQMRVSITACRDLAPRLVLLQTRWYARGNKRPPSPHGRPQNPLVRYLQSLRWVPIPLGVGFAYISYQQYGHVVRREERKLQTTVDPEDLVAKDWVVRLYKCLPFKMMSRLWGRVNDLELPIWMRGRVFRGYSRLFGCNMEEAAVRDWEHYRNLGEFFRRRLRPSVRPVDAQHSMTCPSDGIVLHFGRADRGVLEQVKGITYSMQDFLGPQAWPKSDTYQVAPPQGLDESNNKVLNTRTTTRHRRLSNVKYAADLRSKSDNEIYHCVIYLAPGDYHGFHSPAEWVVNYRRHFPGELFSVKPGIARLVRGLFNLNERVVYLGHWKHGFCSLTAVGATNVGNIKVYHDTNLETNAPKAVLDGSYYDLPFHNGDQAGIPMRKGEPFGEFNLGSTIVLVFEAPRDFKFRIEAGEKVKYGQALGTVPNDCAQPPSGK